MTRKEAGKMAIDTEAIAYHVKGILKALGDDPNREGLQENAGTSGKNV